MKKKRKKRKKKMPVSVVCEAASAALRESLANSCGGVDKGNSSGTNGDNLQSKLMANAKRVLLTKIEYEEVNNYGQTVLDALKTKYIILKPNVNNGASSSATVSSSASCSTTPKQISVNGNGQEQGEYKGTGEHAG